MALSNPIFSAAAFISFVLVLIPLPWHLQSWNTGTCLYMFWVGLACLNQFINSVVWTGHALNLAPVWCDISTRFIVATTVAIPAVSLCINRRLYMISRLKVVGKTNAEVRREAIVDLTIGLGIPIVQMALQLVVEGHRFDIFEDIGCMPFTYNVTLAYPLVWGWPLVIGLISLCYSIPSIIAFRQRHSDFMKYLASGSSLNANRYLRLMILASLEAVFTIPLSIYTIVVNATVNDVAPWISWEETHFGYSRVDQLPAVLWRGTPVEGSLESGRWLLIACAIIFFGFFGLADEAQKHYKDLFERASNKLRSSGIGFSRANLSSTASSASLPATSKEQAVGSRPIHVHREIIKKCPSIDTFDSITSSGSATSESRSKTEASVVAPLVRVQSQSRSSSVPGRSPATPLLPSFAQPDENSASSHSAHFSPRRSSVIDMNSVTLDRSCEPPPASAVPSSVKTIWSRSSAALSPSELFTLQRFEETYHERELPPFPSSPTALEHLSFCSTQTRLPNANELDGDDHVFQRGDVEHGSFRITILKPPPLTRSRSPLPNGFQPTGSPQTRPDISAASSFLDLSSPSSTAGFSLASPLRSGKT